MRASGREIATAMVREHEARRRVPLSSAVVRTLSIVVVLSVWEVYGRRVNPIFLAPPSGVASAAYDLLFISKTLVPAFLQSLYGILLGMALASLAGLALGFLMGMSKTVNWAIEPYITLLYNMPRVALIPLLILWLGVDLPLRVAIVFLGAFFPIVISTFHGIENVDAELIETSRAFAASEWQVFRTIIVPATIPFTVIGIRLGLGRALVGIIVAEMFASQTGLGGLVVSYGDFFKTAEMLVPILVIAFLGLLLTELVKLLERRLSPQRTRESTA